MSPISRKGYALKCRLVRVSFRQGGWDGGRVGVKGRVLVAGGGIGGLTAALCLTRAGFEAAVFEQAPEFTEVGAGLQLSPNGSRVLHHLRLAPQLEARAFLPDGTEFRHWRSGKVISRSALGQTVRNAYGFPYYHIHRADLLRLLLDAAEQEGRIELRRGAQVRGFEQTAEGVAVRVGGGAGETLCEGAVLVGADGIHSTVRNGLFGAEAPAFTGNVAWRALVSAECLPKGRVRPVTSCWWGPGRHFVHYYVRGGALVNCVCVVEKAGWEVESWTERGKPEELKADFAGWHADIQTLIDHMDPSALYKWALHDRPPLDPWGEGLVTLLGDACHPMLPFMAQGAATAIEDAAVLASCLAAEEGTAASLRRYENLRRPRTAWIQARSRRNAKLFHLSGISAWLRNRAARLAGGNLMDDLFRYDALTAAQGEG